MSSLTDKNVSDSYLGLLHSSGTPLPTSSVAAIYDGEGNKSALSLGRDGNGVDISGNLSTDSLNSGSLSYPNSPLSAGGVLIQQGNSIKISEKLPSDNIPLLTPSPAGTYSGIITKIIVNPNGLVTSVEALSATEEEDTPPPSGSGGTITDLFPNGSIMASARVTITIPFNSINDQGSNFLIKGSNIASVVWIKKGLYRVTFTTPFPDSNYKIFLQNEASGASGEYPPTDQRPGENNMIVGYKSPAFFEFVSRDDAGYENMETVNILVVA